MGNHFALIICVFMLAGFTQGLSGFGFGLVSMALLPLLVYLPSAATIVNRRHLSWHIGTGLIAGSCCGVLPSGIDENQIFVAFLIWRSHNQKYFCDRIYKMNRMGIIIPKNLVNSVGSITFRVGKDISDALKIHPSPYKGTFETV